MARNNPLRVLFLCTGNAARSQMAEALLRHLSRGRVAVFSAGSEPQPTVHPMAKQVLEEKYGVDASGLRPKPLGQFVNDRFDFVITVCDAAAANCPVFPAGGERAHWSFADPTVIDDAEQRRRAFEHVASGLAARLRIWMSLPAIRDRIDGAAPTTG